MPEDLMKKFILIIITIAFFIYPSICLSSYLIELKNGSTFITNHYWKEGRQIKFYYRGGIVGIRKGLIRQIRESDLPYKEEVVEEKAPPTPDVPEVAPKEAGEKAGEKTEAESEEIDIEYYKKEKQRLEQKLDEAKQRYLSSLEKGDKETKHAASRDVLKINIQIDQLKKELKEKNKGVLPEWWNE
jgi:hypothetical protein